MGVTVRMALEEVEDNDGGVGVAGCEGVDVDASVGAVHATGYSYCGNEAYASGRSVAVLPPLLVPPMGVLFLL